MPILNGSSQKVPDSPDLSSGPSSFIIEKSPVCQGKRGSEVKITKEQVLHVARLSSLSLDSGEEERVALELSRILDYVEGLASVQLPPPGYYCEGRDGWIDCNGRGYSRQLPSTIHCFFECTG